MNSNALMWDEYRPLAVSLTTSIIRSRKLLQPFAASGVSAGPKALVKYFRITSTNKLALNIAGGSYFSRTFDDNKVPYS